MFDKPFCLVEGEPVSKAFQPENIKLSDSLYKLKVAIRDEISVGSYQPKAREIVLWRVSVPDDKKGSAITLDAVDDKERLDDSAKKLSDVFPEDPDKNTFILAQRPSPGNSTCPLP